MATLAELIAEHRRGRDNKQLEAAAGGQPTDQGWWDLRKGTRRSAFPLPETLRGVARALDVSVELVILAAGETLGLRAEQQSELAKQLTRQLPASSGQLTEGQVFAIRVMVMAFTDQNAAAAQPR